MATTYYIVDWYLEIKEQAGIEDERAAAILAAAYQIASVLLTGNETTIPGAILCLAEELYKLRTGETR